MKETALARGDGTALWRQIAEQVEAGIRGQRFAAGAQLPTEMALAAEYGVNRHTVRRAIAALEEAGLVRIEQGRGTFVQESVVDYWVKQRTRFSENFVNARHDTQGKTLSVRVEPAPDAVAKALELQKGDPVWVIERMAETNGRPIAVTSHYFSQTRFPGLAEAFRESGSITAALKREGIADYTRKVTRVSARMARAADSRTLQQPANKPVMVTESINIDPEGRPLEFALSHWAADRVQIVFEPGA